MEKSLFKSVITSSSLIRWPRRRKFCPTKFNVLCPTPLHLKQSILYLLAQAVIASTFRDKIKKNNKTAAKIRLADPIFFTFSPLMVVKQLWLAVLCCGYAKHRPPYFYHKNHIVLTKRPLLGLTTIEPSSRNPNKYLPNTVKWYTINLVAILWSNYHI